jgi:hypothetical protein
MPSKSGGVSYSVGSRYENSYATYIHIGFEEASLPSTTENRKKQLLHFCIVGGGRE